MPKTEFQDYICLPFCDFYRPGAKEAFRCRGAWLAERLVRSKVLDPAAFRGLPKDAAPTPANEKVLETAVCTGCDFRLEDCDFRSPHPPEDARPCGGLLLLDRLLTAGRLSLKDLTEAAD